ncbi:MAG TPA: type I-U CRISPR-associated protein Cas8c, partial [Planctomycetaceae bacterium]|nr:type I-U CRISPR-associated protein Cas8c [Planctomycetaceae bacterium]
MTYPTASIAVQIDAANPGQFFACCGLLELADRLWPERGATGWFNPDATTFHIACDGTLKELLTAVSEMSLTNTMSASDHARFKELSEMKGAQRTAAMDDEKKALEKQLREDPIVITLKGRPKLTLDWFLDDMAGGSRFKTWAGQQSVLSIATSMKQALAALDWTVQPPERCFESTAVGCGLPFNFDSNLGGQGSSLDVGFSFDPLAASAATRIAMSARPMLELLAFVGLQRCRPVELRGQNRFHYQCWGQPLPPILAAAASCLQ